MQFVAIVGGFWQLSAPDAERAMLVATQMGEELAKAGFGLIVYNSDERSLEPHVVSGYVRALAERSGRIRVRYAQSQRGQISFAEEQTRPDLFEHLIFPGDDWQSPFFRSLAEEKGTDALLVLAGGPSTFIAGQIAIARGLPLLASPAFGGAGESIWTQVAVASGSMPSGSTSTQSLVGKLAQDCESYQAKDDERRRFKAYYEASTSRRASAAWLAATFAAMLVTLVVGVTLAVAPTHFALLMFVGLVVAGATGSLSRVLLWGEAGHPDRPASLVLGGVAGFLTGLAYLIPQFIGAPGVLKVGVAAVEHTDKIQFVSAALVAFTAGIGFDTIFDRMKTQAQDLRLGAPNDPR